MRREGNLMTCTVAGLAKYLKDNIVANDKGEIFSIPECDFCIIDDDNVKYTLKELHKGAESWYGLKIVDGGFESDCLVLMADYYGGGSANIAQIWNDGIEPSEGTVQDLIKLIEDTLCQRDFAKHDTLLLVEFLQRSRRKKYTVWLTALKYGEVYVDAVNEEEAKEKAEALYRADKVEWNSGKLTDVEADEIIE